MIVDLYSDTQSRPTEGMRRAIASAEVGDEQRGEDPTTNALEERVAALLGHEAAVFVPSGTMCNQIALRLHVSPAGDEVLVGRGAHPLRYEAGGAAAMSGALLTEIGDPGRQDARFSAEDVRAALRPPDRHAPRTRVVAVEQPTNGRMWALGDVEAVLAEAQGHGLRTHLDGARLPNAAVASGVDPARWAAGFDTAWIDFSKGLGAPVGACLAGSAELIAEAWRYKQMWGGAMRQSGIVAAAALYALDHHWERLADDHARARRLAEGLAQLPGAGVDVAGVETNMVIFSVPDARAFCGALEERGVRMGAIDARSVRAVTHLDVGDEGIERALAAARAALRA